MNEYLIPEYESNSSLKPTPCSINAEQAVLGGVLLNADALEQIIDRITFDDFYHPKHQIIFKAMLSLMQKNEPIDINTVFDEIARSGNQIEDEFLVELYETTPTAANIVSYANRVYEWAVLRRLIAINQEINEIAMAPNDLSAYDVVNLATEKLFKLAQERDNNGPIHIRDVLTKATDTISKIYNKEQDIVGLDTGFIKINEKTNGLQPADLIIVAGRPGMGKTTFAMNIVEHVAQKTIQAAKNAPQKAVLVFSLEMPADALGIRLVASIGNISQTKIRSGEISDTDWPNIMKAASLFHQANLFIDDTAALSPLEMRTRARRIAYEHGGLSLIMVDYLQLMRMPGFAHDNRVNEISEISRALKLMAREFNCPVLALSQLNRSVEGRSDKRPNNSDLRDSGAIEQDADVIMFIYRDEVYFPETSKDKGIAEIIIGKQRNGPTGTVKLGFLGELSRFTNLADDTHAKQADEHVKAHPNEKQKFFDPANLPTSTVSDSKPNGFGVA